MKWRNITAVDVVGVRAANNNDNIANALGGRVKRGCENFTDRRLDPTSTWEK